MVSPGTAPDKDGRNPKPGGNPNPKLLCTFGGLRQIVTGDKIDLESSSSLVAQISQYNKYHSVLEFGPKRLILRYLNPSPRRGLAKLQEHYLVNIGYLAYSDLPQITEPAATATAKGMPTKAPTPPIKIEDY